MRDPSASEIILLARVLTRCAPMDQHGMAMVILAEADEAERHLRLTGSPHGTYGDGSLMSRCNLLCPPAEPMANDCQFLQSLALAANAVLSILSGDG